MESDALIWLIPKLSSSRWASLYILNILMTPQVEKQASWPAKMFCATLTPGMVLAS